MANSNWRLVRSKAFYELSDTNLLIWSKNLSNRLVAAPLAYRITPEQAASLQGKQSTFNTALAAWREPVTKTPVTMANKTAARIALLETAKYLVNTINSNPATTDAQRDELGITKRKKPSPIPPPTQTPLIDIEAVIGRMVKTRLHAEGRKGRPDGVAGASVFTYIGAEAPADPAAWKFEGLTSKTNFEITFPQSASASTVWITANWYNERGETGLASAPVSVNLPASSILPAGASMRVAA